MKKPGCARCGGSISKKKMAMGGTSGTMPPLEGNNPRTYQGQRLKNGGTASLPVCKGGMVRMPDGSCGKRPTTFKKGGATKNAKLAQETKPFNKVTRGDVLKRILQKKGK
jgi:hypothetical protein